LPADRDRSADRPRARGAARHRSRRVRLRRARAPRRLGGAHPVTTRRIPMAKKLVLLTYSPRELDEEEYARFIREIDYPAFRQNPHIIDYSCWRIAESVQGREKFTHFDLMAVDDLANWQA